MHKTNHKYPPERAERILEFLLKKELVEEIIGDLEEQFYKTLDQKGYRAARRKYWYQMLNYLRPFALKNIQSLDTNFYDMYRNYLKIGFRHLWRNLRFSLINIGGLAMGMTIAILIGLWINNEFSYNKNFINHDRIAQVFLRIDFEENIETQAVLPITVGSQLQENYGDDFEYIVMANWPGKHILSRDQKVLTKKGQYMDIEGPHMLSLNMIKGSRDGLNEPGSILISASAAQVYFGEQDPMGQSMIIDNELSVQVTGVYEDFPVNSSWDDLDFIAPWQLYVNSYSWVKRARDEQIWDDNSYLCYTQIASNAKWTSVQSRIENLVYDNVGSGYQALQPKIILQPMANWHLRSKWTEGQQKGGLIQYVYLFGIIGFFVLLLACINFMNLSTAQSERRAKEIGVRKSLGSMRNQLVNQFLTESYLISFIAFVLAIVATIALLPAFNQIANTSIVFPFSSVLFWMICLACLLITGFLAGSYPAFYLSSFKPVNILKGLKVDGKPSVLFRKTLVVVQFTISIVLIIGTIAVQRQIQFSKNRDLGYQQEGRIMMELSTTDFEGKYHTLRNQLIANGAIEDMATSSSPMTGIWNTNGGFSWSGKSEKDNNDFATIFITHDYGNTVGWELTQGRDFSRDFKTDSIAYIINESAVKYMNLDEPVGTPIRWHGGREHPVIGVVKDMTMKSPFEPAIPSIYIMDYTVNTNFIFMKLNPELPTKEALARCKAVFAEIGPNVPFDVEFADEVYGKKFARLERIGQLSNIFAILAILISCLGLFGLAAYTAAQRTREIGIRKVLGASVSNLWQLLSKDFILLVLIACGIGIPLAYWGVHNWLQNYEYRTSIGISIFLIAVGATLLITLLTVSFQAIYAARKSPVESIKV